MLIGNGGAVAVSDCYLYTLRREGLGFASENGAVTVATDNAECP